MHGARRPAEKRFGAGRRRPWRGAASVGLAGALLVGAGGCGGGDGTSDHKPTAPASGSGAMTEEQLDALALSAGETIGPYTVTRTDGVPLGDDYTADPRRCQPLVSVAEGLTAHDPAAEANREVDVADELLGLRVLVQLRSYEKGRAADVMKGLSTAGARCAGGYFEERAIAKAKILKVEPVPAPDLGDEAQSYRYTVLDVKGRLRLYEYLTVIRSGSTTLSFRADFLGTEDIGAVPDEVVEAQWKKFDAGRDGGA
ncbi:hypothetical protein AB0M39_17530 [Streptomyces sp. NPDC051907]|uniref:hypothetical protein n=1 Tax=Streptomyces sp. NPDC051907 TaxID=3155284 RepID=UPI00341CCF44